KVRLFEAGAVKALLYERATWMSRYEDFDSLRAAHHKLFLRVVGFRGEYRNDSETLSYRAVLEMTNFERIEKTIPQRQLWFAGALVRQEETRLPNRVMNGGLTTQRPKEAGRPPKQ
ncbi:unnamed protein product, partial [Sphacelaria rigidula]